MICVILSSISFVTARGGRYTTEIRALARSHRWSRRILVWAGICTAEVGTAINPAVEGSLDLSLDRSMTPSAASSTMAAMADTTTVTTTMGRDIVDRLPGRRGATGLIPLPRVDRSPVRKSVSETAVLFCRPGRIAAQVRRRLRTDQCSRHPAGRLAQHW